jgi:hypothetical protein
MSSQDDFESRAKALFDDSVDGLDGATRSRLNRGRQRALAELGSNAVSFGRWTRWAPVTGVAAAAAVAVVLWNVNPAPGPGAQIPVYDFELLMNDDSLEMLQDLEFYSWMDIDGAPADGNLG